jgi:cyclopropane fatty-acyl-phospholipid synthase-like methyltransferase
VKPYPPLRDMGTRQRPPGFAIPPEPGDPRSAAEIREHYEVEKELAARLRNSTREQRLELYSSVYDELYERITSHPLLSPAEATTTQVKLIERYLDPDTVFLEIGAGDCSLSLVVAARVRQVYALEVSQEIASRVTLHQNLEVLITDGIEIPVPSGSVTLAYSNQVLEHLHPDDADEHFRRVYAALGPGGRYVCLTPNRLMGPTDVSKYFDKTPTGFHLREYAVGEVATLMRAAGFRRVEAWTTRKGLSFRVPRPVVWSVESALDRLPRPAVRRIGGRLPLRVILGCYVVAVKI